MKHNYKSIAVIMGGWSAERDVSLSTGKGFIEALQNTDYRVQGIDVKKDLPQFLKDIQDFNPDVIINAMHGTGGEDGVIQGVLEMLNIPYTHSNVLPSAIAMNKIIANAVFQSIGIPCAPNQLLSYRAYKDTNAHPFGFPYVIKPVAEGSSRGVFIINSDQDKEKAVKEWSYGESIIAEKYIPGREIDVAIINGKAIGAIEIKPHGQFYDYEAKYTDGKATHIMPAPLSEKDLALMYDYAQKAHSYLGCQGITRADFRLNETDDTLSRIVMLELNTQPGMTPLSLVPEIAAHYHTSFLDLIEIMLDASQKK